MKYLGILVAFALIALSITAVAQLPQLPANYPVPNCAALSNKSDDTTNTTGKTFNWTYRRAVACDVTLPDPGRCGYWCSTRITFAPKASSNFMATIKWYLGGELRRTQICWGGIWYDSFPSDSIIVTKCASADTVQIGGQRGGS